MSDTEQVALVTGASRGIGKAIALELGKHGFLVIGTATTEGGAANISQYLEEAGIGVGDVRYHSSQPWPFPSSLMIGCIATLADGASDRLTVDRLELQDARWFDRPTVRAALLGQSTELFVPPPFAVAHHIIRAWAAED